MNSSSANEAVAGTPTTPSRERQTNVELLSSPMTDESGKDAKVLAVPVDKLTPQYQHIKKATDLGQGLLDTIAHFFTHYKDLEKDKWVKVDGWEDLDAARKEILDGIERNQTKAAGI